MSQSETEAEAPEVTEIEVGPDTTHCRHCGQVNEGPLKVGADLDWQCQSCERWQSTVACPTCNQPVHIDMLEPGQVPAAHAPVRRRRAKE